MTIFLEPAQLTAAQQTTISALEQELHCWIVALTQQARRLELSEQQVLRLQQMEKELGATLIAYEPMVTIDLAKPNGHDLKRLQELEKDTGYLLVAYRHVHQDLDVESFRHPDDASRASLSETQLERLQSAETETGLVLMAYKAA
jgi:hypothetical protein